MKKDLKLPKEQEEKAIGFLKGYLQEELELKIGDLRGKLFLDEIGKNLGLYYYNLGLKDSITMMNEKLEDVWELERREK